MDSRYILGFVISGCLVLCICSAQDEVNNGYIFTSPRTLNKGQNNQLQLIRFGCLEETVLNVQVYFSTYYSSDSKETLAKEQTFQLPEGDKESLLQLYLDNSDDSDKAYSGRIQINGTMCGKPISGTDDVYFSSPSSYIYIIQTDKHLYKPGQKVKFRVLKLDKNLKPTNRKNDTGDIFVEDPQGTRLFQFKDVRLGLGIMQEEFPLADEPVHGTWRITVNSGQDTGSTSFEVKDYKLPKFDVSIKFPSFVLQNAESFPVSVCAEYTYGEPVKATLNLNTSLEMYSYESSYSRTPILQDTIQLDGCYNYTVQVSSIDPNGNHKYKRVMVKANVIEDGTGVEMNKTEYLSRSYSPLKLDFNTGENQGEFYKPGLPYNGKLKVTNPDNTPAQGEPVQICSSISRKRVIENWLSTRKTKYCSNYTSDENGYIKFTIVPQNVDSVSIDLDAKSLKYTRDNSDLDQPSDFANLSPFYSPSGNFLQLETISKPLLCETQQSIRVLFTSKENSEFKFHYEILKQGEVVRSGVQNVTFNVQDDVSSKYENENEIIDGSETQLVPVPELSSSSSSSSCADYCPSVRDSKNIPPIGEAYIPIDVDADLSPAFTLLVFYVREDRETVADSQKIQVEKCFKNKVGFKFADAEKQPGTPTSIRVTSSPYSVCGLKVVDKSVTLLDSNDQLTKDRVFQLLDSLNTDSYYSSDLCDKKKLQPGLESSAITALNSSPDTHQASSYEDSYSAFQEAGFVVISNLILFSRPCKGYGGDAYADEEYETGEYVTAESGSFETGSYESGSYESIEDDVPTGPISHKRLQLTKSAVSVRDYFPETWLFQLQMTGPDGVFEKKETLPHTITEWIGSAACISVKDGLGLSDTTSIYGFQAFFISFTLPVTVVRGEEFTVVVSISSYVDDALPIAVSLDPTDGFKVTSDLANTNVCIQPRTSNSQNIKLQATKLGALNITVRAETSNSSQVCGNSPVYDSIAQDALRRSVEVEAEGFPNVEVNSILFCPQDEENQKFTQSYNLNTPDNAVPDSARAIIDITGNVMGPATQNLNNLVSLPTGCGEQNMVKFTPNYLVLNYLTDIAEMTGGIQTKAIRNLNTGYQQELSYRHYDGSFSAFGEIDKKGSMFLTAFVLRSFYQAQKYIFVDDSVLTDAQKWITSKQKADGCFPNVGQIIDSGIQGGLEGNSNNGAITAYVLASLLISKYSNSTIIGKGMTCLQNNPPSTPYETFLYAYAEALSGNKAPAQKMVDNIKPQANMTDGVEYYPIPGASKSIEIEAAAYAVLTNLKLGNSKSEILPLVRYLTSNLNPFGGFQSTQDTCVGLDALSKFAKLVYNDPVSLSVTVSGGLQENVNISEYNKLVVQRNEVTQVPSVLNIEATGKGCGLLQTSLRYNTLTPPDQNQFKIQVVGECANTDCKQRKITTAVSYVPNGKKSGMSVVQIKMITGLVPDQDSLDKVCTSKRKTMKSKHILGYLISVYFVLCICSAEDEIDNGYIFTSPRTLDKGQNNQLQFLRFGCREESILKVQVYYSSNSNEILAKEQIFQLQEGEKDSFLQLSLDHSDISDDASGGRIQINGTMCGKSIRGSDDVYFSAPSSYIYIIETDKNLYNPGQTVKFRVLKLDKNLKPSNRANDTGDIYIEDDKGTIITAFKGVQLGQGMVQKEFPIVEEAIYETWKINVISGPDKASTSFVVERYFFPKFVISINFPSFVLRSAESVPVSVCAEYPHGEPVKGTLNLETRLTHYIYERYTRSAPTPTLQDSVQLEGCYNYTVQISSIDPEGKNPFKGITVYATVVEDRTGVQVKEEQGIERDKQSLKLDFNTKENHREFYKPNLPYDGKLKVTNPDDSPAPGEPIEICAIVSRKRVIDIWLLTRKTKYCRNYTSGDYGNIDFTIVPQNVDTFSIDLEANSLKYTDSPVLDHPTASANLNPFFSPSESFLQLERIDILLPCGTQRNIRVLFTSRENSEFKLHYQVLKEGKVLSNGIQEISFNVQDDVSNKYKGQNEITDGLETQLDQAPGPSLFSKSSSSDKSCLSARESGYVPSIGEAYIPIDVDADISPSFTLLVFYVREDKEIVADSQKYHVEKCFKNKVNFQFLSAEKQPGISSTSIRVTSSPNSLCGMKIVDKSNSNDQLSKDRVFELLENFNTDKYYRTSELCDKNKSQPGLESSESTRMSSFSDVSNTTWYEDSYAVFQESGFLVISNLILFTRPCTVGADEPEEFTSFKEDPKAKRPPQTWLFQLQMTGPDGVYESEETLPHTVPEWFGNAACISPQDGFGISDTSSIKGFQAFYLNFTLPMSVVRGEEFTVEVTIFSHIDTALPIIISLDTSDRFKVTSDWSDNAFCIQPKTRSIQKIKLQAIKIGAFNITIRAETTSSDVCGSSPLYNSNANDALTQSIEVEGEGFLNEKVNSILFCPKDEGNQKFIKSYNLNSPDNSVPDSARAVIDITGNVLSPAMQNLNNLVSLPTGCGEQNLVKFIPNYLMLNYLTYTGELTDSIKNKAINNLNIGYQRELSYRRYSGEFSAFGDLDDAFQDASMFMSAFVLRTFYEAKKYIFIDDSMLTNVRKWITSKQYEDGCFPDSLPIIDSRIHGGSKGNENSGTITAYVLASLLISKNEDETIIEKGMACLGKNPASTPYETFLYAYVEALRGDMDSTQMIVDNIKSQSNKTDDLEYYPIPGGSKSLEIETAAYAVLTKIKLGNDKSEIFPLVRYLISNLNPFGGFQSTQDTCIGLEALTEFSKLIYNDPINLSVTVSGGLQEKVKISESNNLLLQRNEVAQIPSVFDIRAEGSGCGILQISLQYNTLAPPKQNNFSIKVTAECDSNDCKRLKISTVARYLPKGQKAGMSVIQIKMITGVVPDKESINNLNVLKYDVSTDESSTIMKTEIENKIVNIYFSEISNNVVQHFSFAADVVDEVENPQPSTAKIFDYYSPEYSASTTYTFPKSAN